MNLQEAQEVGTSFPSPFGGPVSHIIDPKELEFCQLIQGCKDIVIKKKYSIIRKINTPEQNIIVTCTDGKFFVPKSCLTGDWFTTLLELRNSNDEKEITIEFNGNSEMLDDMLNYVVFERPLFDKTNIKKKIDGIITIIHHMNKWDFGYTKYVAWLLLYFSALQPHVIMLNNESKTVLDNVKEYSLIIANIEEINKKEADILFDVITQNKTDVWFLCYAIFFTPNGKIYDYLTRKTEKIASRFYKNI